jgi:anti-sigma factor RsiW
MDDILLMAYVDGGLTPCGLKEVERAISISAEIAERVALFKASALPYRQAFRHQQLPPVPESLNRKIAEMTCLFATSANMDAVGKFHSAGAPAFRADARAKPAVPVHSKLRLTAPWLAVAFVTGVFCCGAALRFVGFGPHATMLASASPWVTAAADYQRLYTRDTVAFDLPNSAVASHIVDNIRRDDGLPIRIPDLRSLGLTFKRVQRLRFNDRPLVQIVYLPEQGPPVALCVVKEDKPDTVLAQQLVDSMDVVTWRQARLGYALIASPGNVDLGAIGKQIFESRVDAILGQTQALSQALGS